MEGETVPEKERRERTADWLIPVLAIGICAVIGLYFGMPAIMALFPRKAAKSPLLKAINNARQVMICLRLYSPDNDGKYPAKIEDVVNSGVITQTEWDKIKDFDAAADGISHPWIVALDLDDSAPSDLPLIVSPVPTKEGAYILLMNDGSVTTARSRADFDDVMDRLKKYREAHPAKAAGAPATAVPTGGAP